MKMPENFLTIDNINVDDHIDDVRRLWNIKGVLVVVDVNDFDYSGIVKYIGERTLESDEIIRGCKHAFTQYDCTSDEEGVDYDE